MQLKKNKRWFVDKIKLSFFCDIIHLHARHLITRDRYCYCAICASAAY